MPGLPGQTVRRFSSGIIRALSGGIPRRIPGETFTRISRGIFGKKIVERFLIQFLSVLEKFIEKCLVESLEVFSLKFHY